MGPKKITLKVICLPSNQTVTGIAREHPETSHTNKPQFSRKKLLKIEWLYMIYNDTKSIRYRS